MKKLYCGGTFPFDYQNNDYLVRAELDFRARLLGSAQQLLQRSSGVPLRDDLLYTGPFYFEAPEMEDTDIVQAEQTMVKACTHAVFLLDDGCCPGTITELILASLLEKHVAVFYIQRSDDEETESALHSPCWYPIVFSRLQNPNTAIFPCSSYEDATNQIIKYVREI